MTTIWINEEEEDVSTKNRFRVENSNRIRFLDIIKAENEAIVYYSYTRTYHFWRELTHSPIYHFFGH